MRIRDLFDLDPGWKKFRKIPGPQHWFIGLLSIAYLPVVVCQTFFIRQNTGVSGSDQDGPDLFLHSIN
jgi:hypothetical protein